MAMALAVFGIGSLDAQTTTLTFVGETAGDDVSLLLGDAQYHFGGLGLAPVIGLQTYVVMDEGTDSRTAWAVNPAAGVRYSLPTGFVQGLVGYAWTQVDEAAVRVPFFGGGDAGVTTNLHGEFWGDGRFGLQGIAAYNWGAEYLWSRARGTFGVHPSPSGAINLGLEAGWQGQTGTEGVVGGVTQPNYAATMVGPLVQWSTPNVTAGLGAGWKNVNETVVGEGSLSTWYARVELVFMP